MIHEKNGANRTFGGKAVVKNVKMGFFTKESQEGTNLKLWFKPSFWNA
jgi:hypothetical protein